MPKRAASGDNLQTWYVKTGLEQWDRDQASACAQRLEQQADANDPDYWRWGKGWKRLQAGKRRGYRWEQPTGYATMDPEDTSRPASGPLMRGPAPKKPDNSLGSDLRSLLAHSRDDRVVRAVLGEPQYNAQGTIIGYAPPQRNRSGLAPALQGAVLCKHNVRGRCVACDPQSKWRVV